MKYFPSLLAISLVALQFFSNFDQISGQGAQTCHRLFADASAGYNVFARAPTPQDPINQVVNYQATFNGQNYILPRAVHADLRPHHLNCGRRNFGNTAQWNNQMAAMQQWNGDEKGHLIASQLCGPIEWYNLAPQQASTNRNRHVREGWINMENALAGYLRQGMRVDMTVILDYIGNDRRPAGFRVCAVSIDGAGAEQGFRNQYFNNRVS